MWAWTTAIWAIAAQVGSVSTPTKDRIDVCPAQAPRSACNHREEGQRLDDQQEHDAGAVQFRHANLT